MPATKRRDATQRPELDGKSFTIAANDRIVEQAVARGDRFFSAERNRRACLDAPLQHRQPEFVVDADGRNVGTLDDAFLDGGIIFDRSMPIEMIRRNVQHHADCRLERRRQIDLKRRHLDDVKPLRRRLFERQDRPADVAAELYIESKMTKNVRDERRRRRFAVGAGDRDEGRTPARAMRSRAKISMSPMISTPLARAVLTVQCGSGWVSGTPGARTNDGKLRPVCLRKIDEGNASRLAASRPVALSSQAATLAPPARSERTAAIAGATETEHRNCFAVERRGANHRQKSIASYVV